MGDELLQSLEAKYLIRLIESLEETQRKLAVALEDYKNALTGLTMRMEKRITLLEVRSNMLWGALGLGAGGGGTWFIIKTFGEKVVAG